MAAQNIEDYDKIDKYLTYTTYLIKRVRVDRTSMEPNGDLKKELRMFKPPSSAIKKELVKPRVETGKIKTNSVS